MPLAAGASAFGRKHGALGASKDRPRRRDDGAAQEATRSGFWLALPCRGAAGLERPSPRLGPPRSAGLACRVRLVGCLSGSRDRILFLTPIAPGYTDPLHRDEQHRQEPKGGRPAKYRPVTKLVEHLAGNSTTEGPHQESQRRQH